MQSKKLKKRNSSFVEIYKRISDELKIRKGIPVKTLQEEFEKEEIAYKSILARSNVTSSKTVSFFSENEEKAQENEIYFLKRKISSASVLEVEIPSFLHDKKNKKNQYEKVKIEFEKEEEKEDVKECFNGKILYFT